MKTRSESDLQTENYNNNQCYQDENMSELIYVLTVIYFIFVVKEAEGENITAFCLRVLPGIWSPLQKTYANLHDRFFNLINIKPASFA